MESFLDIGKYEMKIEVIEIDQQNLADMFVLNFLQRGQFTHHVIWNTLIFTINPSFLDGILFSIDSTYSMIAHPFGASTFFFNKFKSVEIEATIIQHMRRVMPEVEAICQFPKPSTQSLCLKKCVNVDSGIYYKRQYLKKIFCIKTSLQWWYVSVA